MRLLVIGGSGYVAGLVLPLLQRHTIRVFDQNPPRNTSLEYQAGDVGDPPALARAVEGMDAVLYMAMGSMKRRDDFQMTSAFDVNVKGLYVALHAAHHAGISHAVYTSSMSVYKGLTVRYFDNEAIPPDADEVYGFTKRLGEEVCQAAVRKWGMSVTALRLCSPQPEDRWLAQTKSGEPTIATAAEDVARAMLAALEYRGHGFQAFMISGDYQQKFMSMARARELLGWEPLARPAAGG